MESRSLEQWSVGEFASFGEADELRRPQDVEESERRRARSEIEASSDANSFALIPLAAWWCPCGWINDESVMREEGTKMVCESCGLIAKAANRPFDLVPQPVTC